MRLKFFNRPVYNGRVDITSLVMGLVTVACALLNLPMPG